LSWRMAATSLALQRKKHTSVKGLQLLSQKRLLQSESAPSSSSMAVQAVAEGGAVGGKQTRLPLTLALLLTTALLIRRSLQALRRQFHKM